MLSKQFKFRFLLIKVKIIRRQLGIFSSNPPAADRNVSPVESPGDDRCWHSNSLTGKRHRRPPCCLNGLFWWACHRGRGCKEDDNRIINAHVKNSRHVTGILQCSEAHKCLKVRGNIILWYGRTIPFQFSGVSGSQKPLCLSEHMCEKRLHGQLFTAHKELRGRL